MKVYIIFPGLFVFDKTNLNLVKITLLFKVANIIHIELHTSTFKILSYFIYCDHTKKKRPIPL